MASEISPACKYCISCYLYLIKVHGSLTFGLLMLGIWFRLFETQAGESVLNLGSDGEALNLSI